MNKQDYKAIAEIIKDVKWNYAKESQVDIIISKLADYFEKEDNTVFNNMTFNNLFKFNRKQFLKDCGVKE